MFHAGIQGDRLCHIHQVTFEVIMSINILFVKGEEHGELGVRDCCGPGLEGAYSAPLTSVD